MNNNGKNIIEHLFDRSSLADVNTADIQNITGKYPYFGAAQLLLAQKMKQENNSLEEAQIQKTALFFSNSYWLQYLLEKDKYNTETFGNIAEEETVEIITTGETAALEIANAAMEQEIGQEIPETIVEEQLPAENIIVTEEEPIAEEGGTSIEEVPALENIETSEPTETGFEISEATQEGTVTEQVEPAFKEAVATFENSTDTEETKDIYMPTPVIEQEKELDKSIIAAEPEEPPAPEEDQQPIEDNNEKLSKLIELQLEEFKKPVETTDQLDIKSGPYHTIDYFASQGIRVGSNIPADKFGAKVRKFTDWLKQMKSASAQPTDLGTDPETEHLIETIAQTSNETKDIVTEAMAEVLKKQGKTEKALQLYKKLSFLNPSKSAYFAAKIEELNKQ